MTGSYGILLSIYGYCIFNASGYAFHAHGAVCCPNWNRLQGFLMLSDIAELEDSDWTDLQACSFPAAFVQVYGDPWHASLNLIQGLQVGSGGRLILMLLGGDVD